MIGCGVLMFAAFGLVLIGHGMSTRDRTAIQFGVSMLVMGGVLGVVLWKRMSGGAMGMTGARGARGGGAHSGGGLADAFGFGPPFQNLSQAMVERAPNDASAVMLLLVEEGNSWTVRFTSGEQKLAVDNEMRTLIADVDRYCQQRGGRMPLIRMTATRNGAEWNVSTRYE